MMRERERCDRGQPDAFGILQQAFIRRMAFNMTPTKFPTEQILIASILATIAFLLIYMVYVSIKKSRAVLVNGVRDKSDNFLVVWTLLASLLLHILFSYYIVGHKTDIGCFTSWGNKIFRNGFQNFYNPQTGKILPEHRLLRLSAGIYVCFGVDGAHSGSFRSRRLCGGRLVRHILCHNDKTSVDNCRYRLGVSCLQACAQKTSL